MGVRHSSFRALGVFEFRVFGSEGFPGLRVLAFRSSLGLKDLGFKVWALGFMQVLRA